MVINYREGTKGEGLAPETDRTAEQRQKLRRLADQAVTELGRDWKDIKKVGQNGVAMAAKNLTTQVRQMAEEWDLQDEADVELIRACRHLVEAGLASKEDAAEIESVLRMAAGVRGGTMLSTL